MSDAEFPLPPPTFEFLVFSLKTQAEMQLGLLPFGAPGEKEPEPDFSAARHAIDMLAMITDKTRGNLSMDEQRLIENALTELRFRYVQVTERVAKDKAAAAESAQSTPQEPATQETIAPESTSDKPPSS